MAWVKVFNRQFLVTSRNFSGFTVSGDKETFWRFDSSPTWETDDPTQDEASTRSFPHANQIQFWIFGDAKKIIGVNYLIVRVIDLWRLVVDSIPCERGYYVQVHIVWPKVELIRPPYRFEFTFSSEEIDIELNLSRGLPQPLHVTGLHTLSEIRAQIPEEY